MDSVFQFVLMALATIIAIALLPWVLYVGTRLLSVTTGGIGGLFLGSFYSANQRLRDWESRRVTFAAADEVLRSSRLRTSKNRQNNSQIYALAEVLRRTVHVCNEIHHYAADVLAVEHMNELEDHAVCAAYRERVLQTIDVTLEALMKTDVTTELTAAKMLLGLDRVRDVCADCPLLQHTRATLPKMCDPAIHMGCSDEGRRS